MRRERRRRQVRWFCITESLLKHEKARALRGLFFARLFLRQWRGYGQSDYTMQVGRRCQPRLHPALLSIPRLTEKPANYRSICLFVWNDAEAFFQTLYFTLSGYVGKQASRKGISALWYSAGDRGRGNYHILPICPVMTITLL